MMSNASLGGAGRDQAESLRRLVLHANGITDMSLESKGRGQQDRAAKQPQAGVVLVAGATAGVGTSTIALQLALYWRRQGLATTAVDAHAARPALANYCAVQPKYSWAEIERGSRTLREAAVIGPCGLSIIACASRDRDAQDAASPTHEPPLAREVILAQLRRLAAHHRVVIDVGPISDVLPYLPLADQLVLVAGGDRDALKQAYAGLKGVARSGHRAAFWLVCNHVRDEPLSSRLAARVQLTCDECLNVELGLAGLVPADTALKRRRWFERVRQRELSLLETRVKRIADRLTSRIAVQHAVALAEL